MKNEEIIENKEMNTKVSKVGKATISDEVLFLEKEFRTSLKKVRKENGFTQDSLAKKTNMIRETIARIESGKVSPQVNTIIKLLEPIGYKLEIVKVPVVEEEKIENVVSV